MASSTLLFVSIVLLASGGSLALRLGDEQPIDWRGANDAEAELDFYDGRSDDSSFDESDAEESYPEGMPAAAEPYGFDAGLAAGDDTDGEWYENEEGVDEATSNLLESNNPPTFPDHTTEVVHGEHGGYDDHSSHRESDAGAHGYGGGGHGDPHHAPHGPPPHLQAPGHPHHVHGQPHHVVDHVYSEPVIHHTVVHHPAQQVVHHVYRSPDGVDHVTTDMEPVDVASVDGEWDESSEAVEEPVGRGEWGESYGDDYSMKAIDEPMSPLLESEQPPVVVAPPPAEPPPMPPMEEPFPAEERAPDELGGPSDVEHAWRQAQGASHDHKHDHHHVNEHVYHGPVKHTVVHHDHPRKTSHHHHR